VTPVLKQQLYQSGRRLLEVGVWVYSQTRPRAVCPPAAPRSLFVLRNNDLGDLLVITPLFAALRQRFPQAEIVAGVGEWHFPILQGNPYLSEAIAVNAPWFNKFVQPQGWGDRWRYLSDSEDVAAIARRQFEIGIDILGSTWGALLLLRAGIPYRLGTSGFAGGASAMQQCVPFDPQQQVGRAALRFAELLGATELPPCRPQLFLTAAELRAGEQRWQGTGRRLAIAPGSGCDARYWGEANYWQLVAQLVALDPSLELAILGGRGDADFSGQLSALGSKVRTWAGQLSLRESFALLATADVVVTNSSMALHAAAAFDRPTLVLLGPGFASRRQHDAQWGYEGNYASLGQEPGEGESIATPGEAIAELQRRGWLAAG